jgi:hypothetical protein
MYYLVALRGLIVVGIVTFTAVVTIIVLALILMVVPLST